MSFTNLYYKRAAATQKGCFICSRPTTTVLATKDSVDFFYCCDTHLNDSGFASAVGESGARKLGLSDSEIQKIKEEYEEKQRRRREGATGGKSDEKDKDKQPSVALPSQSPSPSSPIGAATHQRYSLHREIFAMRLDVHRKRRQTTRAKEVAPRLPSAPQSSMPTCAPPS